MLNKINETRGKLGKWQHGRYNDNKGRIIDQLIDRQRSDTNTEMLRGARIELSSL